MLRTTPIRREANHEDAVVLDLDRVSDVPGEDVPVDDRLVAVGREDLESWEIHVRRIVPPCNELPPS